MANGRSSNQVNEKERIINLPKILDVRGNLSFIEEENHIPFKIKRTYWIYDVPGGEVRGGHAFKKLLVDHPKPKGGACGRA